MVFRAVSVFTSNFSPALPFLGCYPRSSAPFSELGCRRLDHSGRILPDVPKRYQDASGPLDSRSLSQSQRGRAGKSAPSVASSRTLAGRTPKPVSSRPCSACRPRFDSHLRASWFHAPALARNLPRSCRAGFIGIRLGTRE